MGAAATRILKHMRIGTYKDTNNNQDRKMNVITLRAGRPSEAPYLTELAIRSKAVWGYSEAFMHACRQELTVNEEDLLRDDFHVVVAQVNSSIAGYYALSPLSESAFELDALFVEPEHIGKGVGRRLMDDAKKEAKSRGASVLTIQGDPHAEPFYLACGGKQVGSRESGSVPGRFLPLFEVELRVQG